MFEKELKVLEKIERECEKYNQCRGCKIRNECVKTLKDYTPKETIRILNEIEELLNNINKLKID